jgi:hypothetical protein
MTTAFPFEFRLKPARAGLDAVADPQRRNLQAGTAIFKYSMRFELMNMKFLYIIIATTAAISIGCGSSTNTTANTNTNTAQNMNVAIDQKNMPEGISTTPIAPSAETTPGIPDPAVANNVPVGATPTPGIPDPATLGKKLKPGATPTPGIPDPETLRRQLQSVSNVNVNTPPANGDNMMMRKNVNVRPGMKRP